MVASPPPGPPPAPPPGYLDAAATEPLHPAAGAALEAALDVALARPRAPLLNIRVSRPRGVAEGDVERFLDVLPGLVGRERGRVAS